MYVDNSGHHIPSEAAKIVIKIQARSYQLDCRAFAGLLASFANRDRLEGKFELAKNDI